MRRDAGKACVMVMQWSPLGEGPRAGPAPRPARDTQGRVRVDGARARRGAQGHGGTTMHATRLLESQHRRIESLLRRLGSRAAPRRQLMRELADVVAAHVLIEEELLYPPAAAVIGWTALRGYEEHQVWLPVIERLLATRGDDVFDVRLAVWIDVVRPHLSDEENDLFPRLDRALCPELNERLGAGMSARFEEVLPLGLARILALRPDPSGIPGGL